MKTLTVDADTMTKSETIGHFADELGFAGHWKPNWDSFIDCMRDVMDAADGDVLVKVKFAADVTRDMADFLHVLGILRGEYDTLLVSMNDNTDTFSERKAG